jgi:hypothetical protein
MMARFEKPVHHKTLGTTELVNVKAMCRHEKVGIRNTAD